MSDTSEEQTINTTYSKKSLSGHTQTKPTANPLCVPCLHLSQAGFRRDLSLTSLYIPTTT